MFILPEPVAPRLVVEKVFMAIYFATAIFNFVAVIVAVVAFSSRLNTTFSSWGSDAVLSDATKLLLKDCAYNVTYDLAGLKVATHFPGGAEASLFVFVVHTFMPLSAIATMFIYTANDIGNKIQFAINARNLRIKGVTVPVATIGASAILVQSIGLLILTGACRPSLSLIDTYINHCAATYLQAHTASADSVRDAAANNVFGINLVPILVAVALNFFVYIVAVVIAFIWGWTDASRKFEDKKLFWELPPTCMPDAQLLKHYSKWYEHVIDELAEANEVNGNAEHIVLAPYHYVQWSSKFPFVREPEEDDDEEAKKKKKKDEEGEPSDVDKQMQERSPARSNGNDPRSPSRVGPRERLERPSSTPFSPDFPPGGGGGGTDRKRIAHQRAELMGGDWKYDALEKMYYSKEKDLFFNDVTGFYVDPSTRQNYDPNTGEWFQ